jgi:hypothetical protein
MTFNSPTEHRVDITPTSFESVTQQNMEKIIWQSFIRRLVFLLLHKLLMNQQSKSLSRSMCPSQRLSQSSNKKINTLGQLMDTRSLKIHSMDVAIQDGIVILQIVSKLILEEFEIAVVHEFNPMSGLNLKGEVSGRERLGRIDGMFEIVGIYTLTFPTSFPI